VVIHARESFKEILDIVRGYKHLRGIFHAFSGSVEIAEKVTSMGFMIGVGGMITYKKSELPDVVREIPLEYLVLETDSPYLSPVPYRGKRNESSYIPVIAQVIAQIKNIPLSEVARITTDIALKLFNLEPNI
jgi:TatD DNase family protein